MAFSKHGVARGLTGLVGCRPESLSSHFGEAEWGLDEVLPGGFHRVAGRVSSPAELNEVRPLALMCGLLGEHSQWLKMGQLLHGVWHGELSHWNLYLLSKCVLLFLAVSANFKQSVQIYVQAVPCRWPLVGGMSSRGKARCSSSFCPDVTSSKRPSQTREPVVCW